MKIIEPSVKFIDKIDPEAIMTKLESCARTCYQSEDKADPEKKTADKLLANCIKSGHTSILEHVSLTAEIVTDRSVLVELTRHRIGCSYSVESTRYCNYGKMEMTFIRPIEYDVRAKIEDCHNMLTYRGKMADRYFIWQDACEASTEAYNKLLANGATPQEARSVLNNSLKCTMKVTMNIRAWRHFLELRCAPNAHPHIKQIAIPILFHLKRLLPVLFSDIEHDQEFVNKYWWNLRDINIRMLDNETQLNRKIAENSKESDNSINVDNDKKKDVKKEVSNNQSEDKDAKCYISSKEHDEMHKHIDEKFERINKYLSGEMSPDEFFDLDQLDKKKEIKETKKKMTETMDDRKEAKDDMTEFLKELFGEDVDIHVVSKEEIDNFLEALMDDDDE